MSTTKARTRASGARKPPRQTASPGDAAGAASDANDARFNGYEDVVRLNQAAFDAFVQSGAVMARGWQDVTMRLLALAQSSFEDGVAAGQALSGATSLKDLLEVQRNLVEINVGKLVEEGATLSQMGTKLAEEAFAPISGSVSAAMLRMIKPAA